MTLQELKDTVTAVGTAKNLGLSAWGKMDSLHSVVDELIKTNEAYGVTLTQTQVDALVGLFSPQYNAILTEIEDAGDALGTDAFS
jgi:hypothetical protein